MKKILKPLFVLSCFALIITGCQKEAATFVENGDNLNPPVANAGTSQVIQAPASTATLTGTGVSENGPIVGYLWSLVSGPNVPVITSPSSPTTTVSSMIAGDYIFQFMVIDSMGLTGVDTMSVNVLPSLQQTLTLQPTSNPIELNFAGYATGGNLSSQDVDIDAIAWTMSGNVFYTRGAFQFDLSSIPASATIISAKLSLYSIPDPIDGNLVDANSGTANAMYIQRITGGSWSISTTWGTQPATTTTDQVVIPHTDLTDLDLIDLDVKNQVAAMVTTNNYGFMMRLQTENTYNSRQFASSRHADATKHPKLVVVYQ